MRLARLRCAAAILGCLLLFAADVSAGRPRVLLLNSYHQGYKWTDDITAAVIDTLGRDPLAPALYIEYMDTRRMNGGQQFRLLARLLSDKYASRFFSVIIAADNEALNFLKKEGQDIFGDTPVVFCGADYVQRQDYAGIKQVTGVNEAADIETTLDLALELHPKTRRIIVVADKTPTGLKVHRQVERLQPDHRGIEFEFWDDLGLEEMEKAAEKLSAEDLVLFTFFSRDGRGRAWSCDQGIKRLSGHCPVPVYGAWDFNLGYGIVGGMLVSGRCQGRTAADLALRVLHGMPAAQIPVVTRSPNRLMFDYIQLRRFDIDMGDLPEQSLIINRPYSIYERHKVLVWVVLGSIIGLHFIIFSLALNIFRRRKAEERMKKSQRRFNTILTTANEGFWETDATGVIVDVNPEMTAIMGRPRRSIIGRRISDFITPEDTDAPYQDLMDGRFEIKCTFEVRIRRPDKTSLSCLFNITPLFDETGRFTGAFAMVTDITGVKEAEEAVLKSEALLRATFESTEDGLVVVNQKGRVTYMNQVFRRIWKIPPDLASNPDTGLLRSHLMALVKSPDTVLGKVRQMSRSEKKMLETIELVDGRILEIYSHSLLMRGRRAGRVWWFRDVTARKQMESQLIQAQKMEAVGTLAGGIAHDFNNRLQTISGYTQLLLLDKEPESPDRLKLMAIEKAVKRSCQLTEQLLMFSRKIESRLKPIDLNNEVVTVKALLIRALARNIMIDIKMEKHLHVINADPSQIEQIVMNLGINASHAMPNGGRLTITTENVVLGDEFCKRHVGFRPGNYVRLTVADTGRGMEPEILERIFEPFFTTKPEGMGTGLGLSMVHGIVKNHQGQILCHSRPGQGTRFEIYFPALLVSDEFVITAGGETKQLRGGEETILLVDDEPDNLEIGASLLERFGYKVLSAANGTRALELFRAEAAGISLTILDLDLPAADGMQVLDAMLETAPGARVLIASGHSTDVAVKAAMGAGACGFIKKPYQLAEMLAAIRGILDDGRTGRNPS